MSHLLPDPKMSLMRLLSFRLGDALLAFRQDEIREVQLLPTLVQVPEQPELVLGFCRGADRFWPVLCLAGVLGLERRAITAESALIFPRHAMGSRESDFAWLVDAVDGSLLATEELQDAPSQYTWNALCAGVAQVGEKEIPVLQIGRIIQEEERLRLVRWSQKEVTRLANWPETPAETP
jgi:chemotaxis signal transduction protein